MRTYSGSTVIGDFETQAFFDDSLSDTIYSQAPYNARGARDTRDITDRLYASGGNRNMWTVSPASDGGYAATLTLTVALQTPAASAPSISSGGVASAASGVSGVAPGSWIAIYGTNLATTTYTMASSDLVNNSVPTSLNGVSIQIDGKPAYVYYVSPTQVDVLAPADANTGTVSVTVTNSAGTSAPVTTNLQPVLPGLFVLNNYARAVRPSDSVLINGTAASESGYLSAAAAKPGDVLELFGTGFGPTASNLDIAVASSGAFATNNPVAVKIDGISAEVLWAGLVGPGLYQINVVVPAGLPDGDHPVVASVAGVSSPSTALLKTSTAMASALKRPGYAIALGNRGFRPSLDWLLQPRA